MKDLIQVLMMSVLLASATAIAKEPKEKPETRATAALINQGDVERFSAQPFRCFADNEEHFRATHSEEPSDEQRQQWTDLCATSPDGL